MCLYIAYIYRSARIILELGPGCGYDIGAYRKSSACRRDYTREDDRHQETIKDTENIEEQASNKTIYFQYIVQYVMRRII